MRIKIQIVAEEGELPHNLDEEILIQDSFDTDNWKERKHWSSTIDEHITNMLTKALEKRQKMWYNN